MKTRLMPLLLAAGLLLTAAATAGEANRPLPEACRNHCSSAYGTLLGNAAGGVPAFSNCNASCVVREPNRLHGTYTGIKWQCVEFARRWLLVHDHAVFADVDVAADIWNRIDHLERVGREGRIPLQNHPNGSSEAPAPGDLLIYARAYEGTGHVAVITAVNRAEGEIRVAEENYRNRPWPGNYARKIALLRRNGRYWVLDAYVLGWKHPLH